MFTGLGTVGRLGEGWGGIAWGALFASVGETHVLVNVNLVNRRVNLAVVQNPQCLYGLLTC